MDRQFKKSAESVSGIVDNLICEIENLESENEKLEERIQELEADIESLRNHTK